MKILHIIPALSKGGAERLVLDILKQLNKQENTKVGLVIFRDDIKYDSSEINEFVSIISSSVKLSLTKKWIVNVSDLQVYIDNFKPDVIHTHLFEAELVSRFCNYPNALWFSHVHDNMIQLNSWSWSSISKTKITNWYEKQTLFNQYKKNGGTHFIVISKHTESYIKSVQSKYPVTLLHNAIDVKRFQKPADFEIISSSSNINPQPSASTINLINIGSFVPKKNQTLLLDILLELKERGVHANCLFLGDGPLKTEVLNKAKELGISNQCHFLGNVENVEEYLWRSYVYVHTATYEPLGLVLLEAMAARLPVVTLDGGGNRDLIEEGKNGFLIESENAELFVEKILYLKDNKAAYQSMSSDARNFAKNYDIKNYVDQLLALYKA